MDQEIKISKRTLTEWAESLLRMNHLGTLVQRELNEGNFEKVSDFAERSRKRAWRLFNDLVEKGADKPEGYCEPDSID
jgi:hypothetical protein